LDPLKLILMSPYCGFLHVARYIFLWLTVGWFGLVAGLFM